MGEKEPDSNRHTELLLQLRELYSKHAKQAEYEEEEPVFAHLIPALLDRLDPLRVLRPFGLRSTATV